MPESKDLVINTGPLIALSAALGDLDVLRFLHRRVFVPFEVCREILVAGPSGLGVTRFEEADWLIKRDRPTRVLPHLANTLDQGEAAVIQLALDEGIRTVCIDESAGRRIARLNGLMLTGSIGILVRAGLEGYSFSMREAIDRMTAKGIWLSKSVVDFALSRSERKPL